MLHHNKHARSSNFRPHFAKAQIKRIFYKSGKELIAQYYSNLRTARTIQIFSMLLGISHDYSHSKTVVNHLKKEQDLGVFTQCPRREVPVNQSSSWK